MHILEAGLVINLASITTIGACAIGIGFMLCFLVALTKERKRSQISCRLEYRIDSPLPAMAVQTRHGLPVRPSVKLNSSAGAYGRDELFTGTTQAMKEVSVTREYRFTDGSWQELKRA